MFRTWAHPVLDLGTLSLMKTKPLRIEALCQASQRALRRANVGAVLLTGEWRFLMDAAARAKAA
ncbi:hypothetical protein [Rhizobium sp. BK399]|uniref:hypothetical protein n=1 Tax=Rhizobium sp. BK399 TaxID=2587063 RepID=UPI00161A3731|nr:hypothetical protein [Rhizobium sp. BK399]MBB3544586.1 hypothetical protein [Rhizobium sp. BK399]